LLVPHVSIGVVTFVTLWVGSFGNFMEHKWTLVPLAPSMLNLSKGHPSQYYSNEIELNFKVLWKKSFELRMIFVFENWVF
jgi:hypothetical protein